MPEPLPGPYKSHTSFKTQVRLETALLANSFFRLNYIFCSAWKPARDFIFQTVRRKKSHPQSCI